MKYIIFLFLLIPTTDNAWPKKSTILRDAAIVISMSGDYASSIKCQQYRGCIETNIILGPHPSAARTTVYFSISTTGVVLINNWIARRDKPLSWIQAGPLITMESWETYSNINTIEALDANRNQIKNPILFPHIRTNFTETKSGSR